MGGRPGPTRGEDSFCLGGAGTAGSRSSQGGVGICTADGLSTKGFCCVFSLGEGKLHVGGAGAGGMVGAESGGLVLDTSVILDTTAAGAQCFSLTGASLKPLRSFPPGWEH